MIITVTMNPAVDKTVEITSLIPGGLNRIGHIEYDAGGKGINVSKTLKELGMDSIATGFLGGGTGSNIEMLLLSMGIRCDFVKVAEETRTNTKICETGGRITELNESGPIISAEELEALFKKIDHYAAEDTLFLLSGSIPRGIPKTIYREITTRVHEKGGKVLLDADGELFREGLKAGPDLLKPNKEELLAFAEQINKAGTNESRMNNSSKDAEDDSASIVAAVDILKSHLPNPESVSLAVSMGGEGALFFMKGKRYMAPPLQVQVCSTVGAGDAMVAAMAYAAEKKLEISECIRLSMAVSAGAVTTVGTKPPCLELVKELMKQVEIKEL